MHRFRLDLSTPPDWRPLEKLHALLRGAGVTCLDPAGFMFVGLAVGDPHRPVYVYKHREQRSYLLLDACGHAYHLGGGELIGIPLDDAIGTVTSNRRSS